MDYKAPDYESNIIQIIKDAVDVPHWQKILFKLWLKDDKIAYELEYIDRNGATHKCEMWDTIDITCLITHDKTREWNTMTLTIDYEDSISSSYYNVQYL